MPDVNKKSSGVDNTGPVVAKPVGIPLKKEMRYRGAIRSVGYPVKLSEKQRKKLAIKGYV